MYHSAAFTLILQTKLCSQQSLIHFLIYATKTHFIFSANNYLLPVTIAPRTKVCHILLTVIHTSTTGENVYLLEAIACLWSDNNCTIRRTKQLENRRKYFNEIWHWEFQGFTKLTELFRVWLTAVRHRQQSLYVATCTRSLPVPSCHCVLTFLQRKHSN